MPGISIDPDRMTAYATAAATRSATLTAASIRAATADPLHLTPVFGLIGADFLAAYAAAHTTHTTTLTAVSTALASLGTTTTTSAADYSSTDTGYATALHTLEAKI